MSVELHAGRGCPPVSALETVPGGEPLDRLRPNVSGDLPTVFQAAPMFRRAVIGYDRFQVDTYVQWAEDELATADREREHLLARHVATRNALDEAQQLLAHSPAGGEYLRVSPRVASLLATAADEAEAIRAEADAERAAASRAAADMVARAEQALADAGSEAARMIAGAGSRADQIAVTAARTLEDAEECLRDAQVEAEACIADAGKVAQHAAEQAELLRRQAVVEADAARASARAEIVRMLDTAREQRRRTDEEAAALRERLDREAADRRASLLAEIEALEQRRSTLLAQFALL